MKKMPTEKEIQVSILAEESIKQKWNPESIITINRYCPFCYDARRRQVENGLKNLSNPNKYESKCLFCICPIEICNMKGYSSISIHDRLVREYGPDMVVGNLPDEVLESIVLEFQKHIL